MMRLDRPFWIVFITLGAIADLALWYWALAVDHGPRWPLLVGLALIIAAWPAFGVAFLWADLDAERGRAAGEWSDAGYRQASRPVLLPDGQTAMRRGRFLLWSWERPVMERGRVWIDDDGDGEIDEGEMRPRPEFEYHNSNDKEDASVKRQRLRALLQWVYERQRLRQGFDQVPGRKAYPGTYDNDMNELARRGFLVGHSTGHTGRPALSDQAAALVAFDGQEE